MKTETKKKSSLYDYYFPQLASKLDLFGVKFNPTLFSQDKNKSLTGAFLTFILLLLALTKIGLTIYHIIKKDKFTYKHETFVDIDNYFNISKFYIAICADDTFSVINNLVTHNISQENFSSYSEGEYVERNENGYECLNYTLDNFILKDTDIESEQIYIYYMFKVEKNETNSFFNLRFDFPKYYPSISDYNNPLGKRIGHAFINSAYTKGKTLKIYLDKLQVKHQNRYGFGIFNAPIQTENYSVVNSYEVEDNLGIFGYYGYSTIEIFYTGWIQSYTFIGYDIEEEISSIGGFLNVCFVLLSFIGAITNQCFLEASIKKNLKSDFKADFKKNHSVNKNIEGKNNSNNNCNSQFISNSGNNLFGNSTLNSGFPKLNQNIVNSLHFHLNNTTTNTNINENTHIETNENNINKDFPFFQKSQLINIKSFNTQDKTNNNTKVFEKKITFPNNIIYNKFDNEYNIRKVDSALSKSIHFTSKRFIVSEVTQFLRTMDYGIIYKIIKDVILLEFLTLSPRKAKIFYQLRNAPFNLFELDEQLANLSNSSSSSENLLLLDENFKLELFENCILKDY